MLLRSIEDDEDASRVLDDEVEGAIAKERGELLPLPPLPLDAVCEWLYCRMVDAAIPAVCVCLSVCLSTPRDAIPVWVDTIPT